MNSITNTQEMSMTIAQKIASLSPEERERLTMNARRGNEKQSVTEQRMPYNRAPQKASYQERPKYCGHCAKVGENPHGHIASHCPVLAKTRCQTCGQFGHLRSRCPQNECYHEYVISHGKQYPKMVEEKPNVLDEFVVPSKNHKKQKKHTIKPKEKLTGTMFDVLEESSKTEDNIRVPKVINNPKSEWVCDPKARIDPEARPPIQNNSNYTDDDLDWGDSVTVNFIDSDDDEHKTDTKPSFSWWNED